MNKAYEANLENRTGTHPAHSCVYAKSKATMFCDYSDVISVDDLQSMLHIGRNAAYGLLQNGAIATIRVGKKYIIPKASVIEFLSLNKGAQSATISPSGKACESLERSK